MKKIVLSILCLMLISLSADAQKIRKKAPKIPNDWHLLDYAKDSVHGISLEKAYDLLSSHKAKQRTIVAIIDSGGDVNHEDLKNVLWINRDEIPNNGIDDDKNGYIDDVNGWNFVGSNDGVVFPKGNYEADREFLNYYEKYLDADSTKFNEKELEEFRYFNNYVKRLSKIYGRYLAINTVDRVFKYKDDFVDFIKKNSDSIYIEAKDIRVLRNKLKDIPELKSNFEKNSAFSFLMRNLSMNKGRILVATCDTFFDKNRLKWKKEYEDKYKISLASAIIVENERKRTGFEYLNKKNIYFGNPTVVNETMFHGTHVGGTVGADRNNKIGVQGVADVELMFVRVIADSSDETDKDVAAAIKYAVDNGAKIINMSFGKPLSPQHKIVSDAIRYADKKGVLLIHAAGNDSNDIDKVKIYPELYYGEKLHKNVIKIGASGPMGTPARFSNYGKNNVHIFAPGFNVYSTVGDNKYQSMSGTSMAAPVVSGVAALLLNYFPELTVEELISALLDGGVSRDGVTVYKPQKGMIPNPKTSVKCNFGTLSRTGDIINAYGSVKEAIKIIEN